MPSLSLSSGTGTVVNRARTVHVRVCYSGRLPDSKTVQRMRVATMRSTERYRRPGFRTAGYGCRYRRRFADAVAANKRGMWVVAPAHSICVSKNTVAQLD